MSKVVKVALAAVAGFAAGVLMAPKSGKETREDIKKKADVAKQLATEKAEQVKSAVKDGSGSLKKGAGKVEKEAKGMAKSAANSGKVVRDEAERLAEEAKLRGERVADDAKKTLGDLRKDVKRNVK